MTKLHDLQGLGQVAWLNYMRRSFIQSGGLRQSLAQGIAGITANAAVFADTIARENDYDEDIRRKMRAGMPAADIHEALMVDDVQRAADLLHPIFERSDGVDGVASLELDPALSNNTVGIVATARHLLAQIDRGNAMVEVPATLAGTAAIQQLTADGINVNVTHLFSASAFERVAQAYIAGLETYLDSHSVWRTTPTAVASISIAPIDQAVDALLAQEDRLDLQGCTALAEARVLYARFLEIFSGPRWEALAGRGARVLRPKWTRLTPANPQFRDTYYMNELIGPQTVLTFTPKTLATFLDRGRVRTSLAPADVADIVHLATVAALGINLEMVAAKLLATHLQASIDQYQILTESVMQKLVADAPRFH
jgi:transaldolase